MLSKIARTLLCSQSVLLILSGCAKPPQQIGASYVSPIQYESYSCKQLGEEAARVSNRAAEAMGVQQQKATGDAVAMGVGLILFWPALLFIKGNGATETEIAHLKGQMETIEQVSIQKDCGFEFQPVEPDTDVGNERRCYRCKGGYSRSGEEKVCMRPDELATVVGGAKQYASCEPWEKAARVENMSTPVQ